MGAICFWEFGSAAQAASQKDQSADILLITGDRVIAKNTQYVSKTGCQKFNTADGAVKQFIVIGINGSLIELQDVETQSRLVKHVSLLKLVPNATTPADAAEQGVQISEDDGKSGGSSEVVILSDDEDDQHMIKDADDDGGCLYRCLVMCEQIAQGLEPQDDDEASWALRERVMKHLEGVVQKASEEELQFLEEQVQHEMLDDPLWVQTREGQWSWKDYFAWARQPWTFATFCNLNAYVEMTGRSIDVFEKMTAKHAASSFEWVRLGGMVRCQQVVGKSGCGNVQLRRGGKHYDLIMNATAVAGSGPATALAKKGPAAQASAGASPVLKRPASAVAKKGKLAKSTMAKTKKRTAEEKAEAFLQRRLRTPAPFGRCPHMECQAALKVIPPHVSGQPWIACPRFSSKLCKGYIRGMRPGEEAMLPEKLFKRPRLE